MGFHDELGYYREFHKVIALPLGDFREVTSAGAVGNTAANGGILDSATTPVHGAEATSESWSLTWAAGNSDIVQQQQSLPDDFEGRCSVYIDLLVKTDNAGGGGIEAASFTANLTFDDGTQIAVTVTDSAPSTTAHLVSARIDPRSLPANAYSVNVQLVPGTHANDPIKLLSARLRYSPRQRGN